jgi:hypothetical protein
LGPWSCSRERASAGERPVVSEVCSRSAVSLGVRLENWSAIVCLNVSSDPAQRAERLTLATDEDDREWCLLRDLDLFLDRGREGGSELAALMVGRFESGSRVCPCPGPGLADRERRGHGIEFLSDMYNEQQRCCR